MDYRIDNPGGGDCGFYAFSIGLIGIIQKEQLETGTSPTFQRWSMAAQVEKEISFQSILAMDLHKLRHGLARYEKELFALQSSLRNIVAESSKKDLLVRIEIKSAIDDSPRTMIEDSPVYGKFMEMVKACLNGEILSDDYNDLTLSPDVRRLAQQTAVSLCPLLEEENHAIENSHVKNVLLKDVMLDGKPNPDSVILKGLDEVKKQGRWATHDDLKSIASALEVNLWVFEEENGQLDSEIPTVRLNNHYNAHWTTTVDLLPEPISIARPAKKAKNNTALSDTPSEKSNGSYSQIEKRLTNSQKEFVAYHSAKCSGDFLKTELATLLKMRETPEYKQKIESLEGKKKSELNDEELAYKLQEEEFRTLKMK